MHIHFLSIPKLADPFLSKKEMTKRKGQQPLPGEAPISIDKEREQRGLLWGKGRKVEQTTMSMRPPDQALKHANGKFPASDTKTDVTDMTTSATIAAATSGYPTRFFSTLGPAGNLSTTASSAFGSSTTAASAINFYQTEQLTFLWILFVLIVVGNAGVLATLLLSKGHKSRMNFFIKHLAAADLGVGLISVLTDIVWKITISFEAGTVACKLIRYLQCVVTYSSTYVLVAMSIDRYDAVVRPMNFSGSWRRARILVVMAWVLSALFSSPILVLYHVKDIQGYGNQCWINFDAAWQWQLYMTLIAVTLFFIPAILIGGCYIIIVITIWEKSKAMQTTADKARASSGGNNDNDNDQESRRASSRGLIPKAKVKTVKMTFVIIFVFILCWSPYMMFDLLQVYQLIPETTTTVAVATFIQSLAPLNSAANPLIYCLFSTNVGATFWNLLCCRKKEDALPTGLTTSTNSSSSASANSSRPLMLSNSLNSAGNVAKDHNRSITDKPSVTFRAPTSATDV